MTSNWDTYSYDADGRRVKRNIRGQETWQVYGIGGELLAEYGAGAAPIAATKEYGYRGGELLVTMASGDHQRIKRFVTNLYCGALQRDPTPQELTSLSNSLATAGTQGQSQLFTTAAQAARNLFATTNYELNNEKTARQYVTDLYNAYLQRGPDDGGLSGWASAAGTTRQGRIDVLNAFEASGEFAALVTTLYGTASSDNERTEHFVNNFYLGAYGRSATAAELQQGRDALNAAAAQGQSQVQTAAETLGRSLFVGQVSDFSITAQQFVTNLYEGFLQRGPDAGGLSFWTTQAGSTRQARQAVLEAFATSPAFRELSGTLYRETFWMVSDHLGTPRMIADKSGSLAGVKRHDYLPFGEEITAGVGGRTTNQGYTQPDGVRQRFTGVERDTETGLDFMQARYYGSAMGRFTSVDPLMASAKLRNPQTWNRYTYTLNNPLRYVDPSGEEPEDLIKRTRTTTTEVTVQQRGGGQIVQQAKVTITEAQTEYLNEQGEVIEKGAIQTSAVAENTGSRPKQYSDAELRTMENVGVAIVEVSREKGFDATIALGIAATETHMGTLRAQESSAAKQSDVNPMQLSSTSGIRPTTDLRSNIAGSIDVYNRTTGSDLNTNLQIYNNQASRAAYAATAEGHIDQIRASQQTTVSPMFRVNNWHMRDYRPQRVGPRSP